MPIKRSSAFAAALGLFAGSLVIVAAELTWALLWPAASALIVDLTAELDAAPLLPHQRYLCLPTLDATPPDPARAAALIDQLIAHDGCIYVHCASGHGRSASIIAALWVRTGAARDVEEAEARLRAIRPHVRLSPEQRALVRTLSARSAPAAPQTPDPAA